MDPSPNGIPQLIQTNGRLYAAGLFWQNATDRKSIQREAIEFASDPNIAADLIVLRIGGDAQHGISQYGVGRRADGLVRGAIAAAAAAADTLTGTWMGVFPVEGSGWWFVSVRDDYVSADGDAFYVSEDEARDRFDRERRANWSRTFAPEGWDPDGLAQYADLAQILGKNRGPKLTSATPALNKTRLLAFGLLATVIVLLSAWWYTAYQARQNQLAEQARLERALAERLKPIPVLAPWPNLPPIGEWIAACGTGLRLLPNTLPGYQINSLRCSGQSATAQFKRVDGTYSWVQQWFKDNLKNGVRGSIDDSGESAQATISFPALQKRGQQNLYRSPQITRAISERALVLGDRVQINPPIPQFPPGLNAEQLKTAPAAPWQLMQFSIQTKTAEPWFDLLRNMPGTMLRSTNLNTTDGQWTIQGDVYVLQ